MPKRLSEQYVVGDAVEILFEQAGWSDWIAGTVAGIQAPGLWVRLANGGTWFVTNTRRIRHAGAQETKKE
jgi:hypothetical protein